MCQRSWIWNVHQRFMGCLVPTVAVSRGGALGKQVDRGALSSSVDSPWVASWWDGGLGGGGSSGGGASWRKLVPGASSERAHPVQCWPPSLYFSALVKGLAFLCHALPPRCSASPRTQKPWTQQPWTQTSKNTSQNSSFSLLSFFFFFWIFCHHHKT